MHFDCYLIYHRVKYTTRQMKQMGAKGKKKPLD